MAKKKQDNAVPEVSSLPIKHDESPLVIDLPDGQKLVVGHLANGSVIEVATWRGTGRPDSRTSRLMLGMSTNAGASEHAAEETAKSAPSKKSGLAQLSALVQSISHSVGSFKNRKRATSSSDSSDTQESAPFIKSISPEPTPSNNDDVQDWLDSIIAKSEVKAARARTAPVKKAAPKKAVRKAAPKSSSKRSR